MPFCQLSVRITGGVKPRLEVADRTLADQHAALVGGEQVALLQAAPVVDEDGTVIGNDIEFGGEAVALGIATRAVACDLSQPRRVSAALDALDDLDDVQDVFHNALIGE